MGKESRHDYLEKAATADCVQTKSLDEKTSLNVTLIGTKCISESVCIQYILVWVASIYNLKLNLVPFKLTYEPTRAHPQDVLIRGKVCMQFLEILSFPDSEVR